MSETYDTVRLTFIGFWFNFLYMAWYVWRNGGTLKLTCIRKEKTKS